MGRKLLSTGTIMTVPVEEAPANSVPAAAVIRGGQALFGIIGRKGRVGGACKSPVKSPGSTRGLQGKLPCWRVGEVSGIPGVAVKCVDIGRNTSGESDLLDHF